MSKRYNTKALPPECCGRCLYFKPDVRTIYELSTGTCRTTHMGTRYDWLRTAQRKFPCKGKYYMPRGINGAVEGEL